MHPPAGVALQSTNATPAGFAVVTEPGMMEPTAGKSAEKSPFRIEVGATLFEAPPAVRVLVPVAPSIRVLLLLIDRPLTFAVIARCGFPAAELFSPRKPTPGMKR